VAMGPKPFPSWQDVPNSHGFEIVSFPACLICNYDKYISNLQWVKYHLQKMKLYDKLPSKAPQVCIIHSKYQKGSSIQVLSRITMQLDIGSI